jgi:hypothetical protein
MAKGEKMVDECFCCPGIIFGGLSMRRDDVEGFGFGGGSGASFGW